MKLAQDDVREMVRLVGEVAALPGGHTEKKHYLMKGLCKLIDADAWIWGLSCQRDPAQPRVYVSFMNGSTSKECFKKVLKALEHPEIVALTSKFLAQVEEEKAHLTRLKHQITDESRFALLEAHPIWKEADVGCLIMSLRPLDPCSGSAIGLCRRYNREKFTARESRIAHIVLTEVPWLHEQGWPKDRGVCVPAFSNRQRVTLNLLTLGQNRKQIATGMNISMHTVQGYVKNIYRHFNVHSQAELMNRFYEGNGQDVP
jgi:DNA-binding CsgD family transcriptional regulator